MKLRILTGYAGALMLATIMARPVLAQNVNPKAERQLQHWMAEDPRLQSDPGLMDNPTYLRNHPNFATWLQEHPNAHRQVEEMGAYDNGHHWRDTDWWRHNDPDWMYEHHPEWVRDHPEWRHDGDWDDQHHWHDRDWWRDNNRDWVAQHHPEWAEARERHEEKREEHAERHEEKREEKWEKHHDHDRDHHHDHD